MKTDAAEADWREEFVARLRQVENVTVDALPEAWRLTLRRGDAFRAEIDVPRAVLEWFVSVYESASPAALWSDWADYEGYSVDDDSSAPSGMKSDLGWFISAFLDATDLRISNRSVLFGLGSKATLEWFRGGSWSAVSISQVAKE